MDVIANCSSPYSPYSPLINVEKDDEKNLVHAVYVYLVDGEYPEDSTKNEKRIFRRKAGTFEVVDGELYLKKKKYYREGKKVMILPA